MCVCVYVCVFVSIISNPCVGALRYYRCSRIDFLNLTELCLTLRIPYTLLHSIWDKNALATFVTMKIKYLQYFVASINTRMSTILNIPSDQPVVYGTFFINSNKHPSIIINKYTMAVILWHRAPPPVRSLAVVVNGVMASLSFQLLLQ